MSLEFANRRSSHNEVDCEAAYLAQERREGRAVAPAATTASPPARTADGLRTIGGCAVAYSLSAERRRALKKAGRWEAFCAENPWARAYDTV